jgi:hypothetical protein
MKIVARISSGIEEFVEGYSRQNGIYWTYLESQAMPFTDSADANIFIMEVKERHGKLYDNLYTKG